MNPMTPATLILANTLAMTPTPEKPIVFTHQALLSAVHAVSQVIPTQDGDRILALRPFDNTISQVQSLLFPLLRGLTVVLAPADCTPVQIGTLVRDHAVTLLGIYSHLLTELLKSLPTGKLESLRLLYCYGTPLSSELVLRCHDRIGIRPLFAFGVSESCGLLACNVLNVRDGSVYQEGTRVASIGRPFPGFSIAILDTQSAPVATGRYGTLYLKSPCLMSGYYNDTHSSQIINDGWLNTGLQASADGDGFIYIDLQSLNRGL